MRRLLVSVLFLFVSAVKAQDMATDSSGSYEMDLGQVYGAILASKELDNICTRAFPEQGGANASAYKQWRKKYLPFLQEMERHYSAMAWREAGHDPKKHFEILIENEKALDGYRDALSADLRSGGAATFEQQCALYPAYLDSPRMNLESYYSEHVTVVRTGPGMKED